MATSHDVIHGRLGTNGLFAPDSVMGSNQFTDLGFRIVQIAEGQFSLGSLHAGGQLADSQPLCAEIAFFHHPFHTGGEFFIGLGDKGPGVAKVEATGTVRTGHHAEAAADAAVKVHHHDAVPFPLEGRLCRTGAHAGWIFAVVAQHQKRLVLDIFAQKTGGFARKGIVINDLHRHWFAYHSIKVLTRFFSKSKMVRNDAAVSVKRSFRKNEIAKILFKSGIHGFDLSWHWAFRWKVVAMWN